MQKYAPVILRIGLSLVFLWFGISQLSDPNSWIGILPQWTAGLAFPQVTFIYLNGGTEVLFGTLLLVGFFTRIAALILALHLIGIIASVGYSDIAVRDFGLMCATFSVFLHGPDFFALDSKYRRAQ